MSSRPQVGLDRVTAGPRGPRAGRPRRPGTPYSAGAGRWTVTGLTATGLPEWAGARGSRRRSPGPAPRPSPAWLPMKHLKTLGAAAQRGGELLRLSPGPIVSISATMSPDASSRLISPARPDWLSTVNVCVPAVAEVQLGRAVGLRHGHGHRRGGGRRGKRGDRRAGGEGRDHDEHPGHRPRAPSGQALPPAGGRGSLRRGSGLSGCLQAVPRASPRVGGRPCSRTAGMTTAR